MELSANKPIVSNIKTSKSINNTDVDYKDIVICVSPSISGGEGEGKDGVHSHDPSTIETRVTSIDDDRSVTGSVCGSLSFEKEFCGGGGDCSDDNISSSASTTTSREISKRKKSERQDFYSVKFLFCFLNDAFGSGIGEPSVHHALVVIFLEFFAWGLLTTPMITVLNETFPNHTFLMNGLIVGIKGLLSFLSAPVIGALSDIWGRKLFLLLTVFFTCAPIPLMTLNTWWYFASISISGVFAVTFSVVFAYVADVIPGEDERSAAYGLVSATFAASLVMSPALGAYVEAAHGRSAVVALATAIAALDVLFVLVAVPESLPPVQHSRSSKSSQSKGGSDVGTGGGVASSSWAPLAWESADPFQALKKIGKDKTVLLLCVTVLLSYLPEAGQYSCFFVYLRLVVGFNPEQVALFIAVVGIMSVVAQTAVLGLLMKGVGPKSTIIIGLLFEATQLAWYGFGSQIWMMWAAGILAAVSSITYPAISAFVSTHADPDKQGLAQGMVTGMRGLCNGLGPAVFGLIFYLFHVDLNEDEARLAVQDGLASTSSMNTSSVVSSPDIPTSDLTKHHVLSHIIPGPPFVFGSLTVALAIVVAMFIPERDRTKSRRDDALIDLEAPHHAAPLIPHSPLDGPGGTSNPARAIL